MLCCRWAYAEDIECDRQDVVWCFGWIYGGHPWCGLVLCESTMMLVDTICRCFAWSGKNHCCLGRYVITWILDVSQKVDVQLTEMVLQFNVTTLRNDTIVMWSLLSFKAFVVFTHNCKQGMDLFRWRCCRGSTRLPYSSCAVELFLSGNHSPFAAAYISFYQHNHSGLRCRGVCWEWPHWVKWWLIITKVWLAQGFMKNSNSWCDPFKTWSEVSCSFGGNIMIDNLSWQSYTFDPLANITSDQVHLVLGGIRISGFVLAEFHSPRSPQVNNFYGPNNPDQETSTPSFGPALPSRRKSSGQARPSPMDLIVWAISLRRFQGCMMWGIGWCREESMQSIYSQSGVHWGRTPVICDVLIKEM